MPLCAFAFAAPPHHTAPHPVGAWACRRSQKQMGVPRPRLCVLPRLPASRGPDYPIVCQVASVPVCQVAAPPPLPVPADLPTWRCPDGVPVACRRRAQVRQAADAVGRVRRSVRTTRPVTQHPQRGIFLGFFRFTTRTVHPRVGPQYVQRSERTRSVVAATHASLPALDE